MTRAEKLHLAGTLALIYAWIAFGLWSVVSIDAGGPVWPF